MKSCGVLLHITSLPGPGGVGTLGPHTRAFADFLSKAGHRWWQILPTTPAGLGNSPYSSYSLFGGNPLLISPELLVEQELLTNEELLDFYRAVQGDETRVDFDRLIPAKNALLHKAYSRFSAADLGLATYCTKNTAWLDDYALFMSLRMHFGKPWMEWPDEIRRRRPDALAHWINELADERAYWCFVQYIFHEQWIAMKKYVNGLGIGLIGDIPIYAAMDSADVWADDGSLFQLDARRRPLNVAGVPPDGFSKTGQLWGNPLYNWEHMEQDDFAWWMSRARQSYKLCDMMRFDHFRGFHEYYAIPYGDETAEHGQWLPGPGLRFFEVLRHELRDPIVMAEDLGVLTQGVHTLLARTGYPGMKVLQFAFDSDWKNPYLPYNYTNPNCTCYTGTHDNDTVLGWWNSTSSGIQRFARKYLHLGKKDDICWKLIRTAYESSAVLAVAQMQDFLRLGSEARMNRPGVAEGNWAWRTPPGALTDTLAERMMALAKETERTRPVQLKWGPVVMPEAQQEGVPAR